MRALRTTAAAYGVCYVVFTACRMAQVLVFARMLGPSVFGAWAALMLWRQYGQLSDVGASKAIGKLVPRLLHSNQQRRAELTQGIGLVSSLLSTAVVILLMLLVFVTGPSQCGIASVEGVAFLVIALFLDKYYMCLCASLQGAARTTEAGAAMASLSLLELTTGSLLIERYGLHGLYCSAIGSLACVCIAMHAACGVRFRYSASRKVWQRLMSTGLLHAGFALLNIAVHNVDRLAIIFVVGAKTQLSIYQIASACAMLLTQVPSILMTVLSPRIYRHSGAEATALRHYVVLPTALVSCTGAAFCILLWTWLPTMIDVFLSDYRGAISVCRVLVIAEYFLATTIVMENVNLAVGRSHISLILRAIALSISLCVSILGLSNSYNLEFVATVTCAANVLGWLIVTMLVTRATSVPLSHYMSIVLGPLLYAAMVSFALSTAFPGAPHWSALAILCSLSLLPLFATIVALTKATRGGQMWRVGASVV